MASHDVSRRKFLSNSTFTAAGVATGLSYYFSRDNPVYPDGETVRVGFIGIGARGGALLRAMLRVPGSQVVHICDAREEMLEEKKKNILDYKKVNKPNNHHLKEGFKGPKTTQNWRDVLADPDVDAVVIATPQYLHGPMAIAALEAGKSVYCEKAMAYTVGECKDLFRLATHKRKSQVFQVGHQRHYSKMYRKVKEMVQGGRIGNVVAARAQWNRNDEIRRPCQDPALEKLINWRLYKEFNGGLMSEFASHQIDVINMLLGTHPESVCGMGGQDYPRYEDDRTTTDNVHVILNYEADWKEHVQTADGEWRFEIKRDAQGNSRKFPVRFSYMSIMMNSLLRPSEMIFGDEGSIQITLGGGDFWKEAKVLKKPDKIAQGTNPFGTHQKSIMMSGSTIAGVNKGLPPSDEDIWNKPDRTDWTQYIGKIPGGHSPQETLLALNSFLNCIRRARKGLDYHVSANVKIGLWGAIPDILANIAMEEGRTVRWSEFFDESWEKEWDKWPDLSVEDTLKLEAAPDVLT